MHGLGDRVHELNEAAARLAREVADEHGALVAGDLGPTGELMAPLGTMDAAAAQAIFAEQLAGLRDGGIDLVLIETMSDLAEVEAAVAAARAVVPDLPVVATLSFDTNLHTMMGVRPGDAVTALAAAGVDAVGRQLRSRSGARWRRSPPSWSRRVPRGCCSSPSPTPGCRRWSATTSSTTRRPADMAGHADGAARPRHRPDRRLLRLHPGAPSGDQPAPLHDGRRRRRGGRRRPLPVGAARRARCATTTTPSGGCRSRGERGLFERMCLEGFQAGLSWSTILNKRDRFREVFHGFDVDRVRGDDRRRRRAADAPTPASSATGPRSRRPARTPRPRSRCATTAGSRRSCESFRPERTPTPRVPAEVPTTSPESVALSKALRKRGFGFVGPTTMHALMEATGLVDTHLVGCHRRGASGEWT